MEFISNSEKETLEIGKKIAQKLNGGEIICFYGDLGAGKTTLIKGILSALGIKRNITSPTFTLMNLYSLPKKIKNAKKVAHIDTYRLKNSQELIEIGFEDYAGDNEVITLVEWPDKIQDILKNKKTQSIHLAHSEENRRKIETNLI